MEPFYKIGEGVEAEAANAVRAAIALLKGTAYVA